MPLTAHRPFGPLVRRMALLAAALAAMAPSLASVIDARPAARDVVAAFAAHVEDVGATHNLRAHVDHCLLCHLSTRNHAERAPSVVPRRRAVFASSAPCDVPAPRAPGKWWTALSRGPPA